MIELSKLLVNCKLNVVPLITLVYGVYYLNSPLKSSHGKLSYVKNYIICIMYNQSFFVLFGHGMAKYVQCIVDKLLQGNIHSQ